MNRRRFEALVEKAIEYKMLSLHLERIADIAHCAKEEQGTESDAAADQQPLTGAIALSNVHYRYAPDSPPIMKGRPTSETRGVSRSQVC